MPFLAFLASGLPVTNNLAWTGVGVINPYQGCFQGLFWDEIPI
jgi:hypothetical protein